MAVREYICKKTGTQFWDAHIHFMSRRDRKIRVQKFKRCPTKEAAEKAEKVLIKLAAQALRDKELRGTHWRIVVHRWETDAKTLMRNPTTLKPMTDAARINCLSLLNGWTKDWMDRPSCELSIKDGKDLLMAATAEDLMPATIRKLKTYVNLVFRYGVQEGIIEGVRHSPVHGVPFDLSDGDSLPEILTAEQVRKLLLEAKVRKNPWYPIWATAIMTGMRSSELYALRKENVRLSEGIIRVSESWDWVNHVCKETKAGYWRSAPIAKALRPVLEEAMALEPESPYVFPRIIEWERSGQAQVLREFCEEIGVPSVRFHTLRACFATLLLAQGIDAGTIMAIGGWSNYKTFRIYIRLAGVTERHKTEGLGDLVMPTVDLMDSHISQPFETNETSGNDPKYLI